MLSTRSRRAGAIVALAGAAVATGAVMTSRGSDQPVASATPAVAAPGPPATLLVFVSGAVAHPGLYELASGARIADAIADAGGILPSADPGKLPNLSGLVHDGHQVNVPFAKGGTARTSLKVDVNSADVAELETVARASAPTWRGPSSTRGPSGVRSPTSPTCAPRSASTPPPPR